MEHRPAVESEWPSYRGVELYVCPPPYQRLLGAALLSRDPEPTPGAVAYATGQSVLAVLERLAAVVSRWPWVAPCAGLSPMEHVAEKYASLNGLLGNRLAIVHVRAGQTVTAQAIADAVAKRQEPGKTALTAWICARLSSRDLAAPLAEQFEYALGERASLPRSLSFYSRAFAAHTGLSARDWRAVTQLIRTLHWHVSQARLGRDRTASRCGPPLEMRSAQRYTVRYLRSAWSFSRQLVGWEWVLEAALRNHPPSRC